MHDDQLAQKMIAEISNRQAKPLFKTIADAFEAFANVSKMRIYHFRTLTVHFSAALNGLGDPLPAAHHAGR